MLVYYKLYKKTVSPMISTPRSSVWRSGKMVIPGVEVLHEKVKSVRQVAT